MSRAGAEASSSSAKHYNKLVEQIIQDMQGGGFKNPIIHDVMQGGSQIWKGIKSWLGNPGGAPVGDSNAKRSR